MSAKHLVLPTLAMILAGCGRVEGQAHPTESYVKPPKTPIAPGQLVFAPEHLVRFYDVPGEYGHVLEGKDYGFEGLSIIAAETHPGGGPPLHTHDTEEAHILQDGHYRALIGEDERDVTAPAIVRIPAGVPHTFVNTSDRVIHVIGIVPGAELTYTELGANPLIEDSGEGTALTKHGSDNDKSVHGDQ